MKTDPNGLAFDPTAGLTKREWIATQVFAALCARGQEDQLHYDTGRCAHQAVSRAEELIAELNKE